MNPCPCGSQKDYLRCCGEYLNEQSLPQTPEALMRSRYTAYTLGDIAYIKKTMCGKARLDFNEEHAALWAKNAEWLGLQIINSGLDPQNKNVGFVEFIARYQDKNVLRTLHEHSQFQCLDGQWFYRDGEPFKPQKIPLKQTTPRNAPCPCGSGKKYKNCHALNK